METRDENDQSVLFQLPYACPNAPAAVNIWVKNIAKAFALANFKPTIQYLCKDTFTTFTSNNVRCSSVSFPFAAILKTPKLRAVLFSMIQDYYLDKFGRTYSIIAPMGGVTSLAREQRKNKIIKKSGSEHLLPILEHPIVTSRSTDRMIDNLDQIANSYDYLMPITTYLREMFHEHGRTKPTLVNPIIVDTKAIPTSGLTRSQPITNLLYCGNLGHEEEIFTLLDMFSIVQKELPGSKLDILGGGSSIKATRDLIGKYQDYCSGFQASSNVSFHGRLLHSEVIRHYQKAHAFVLPRPFREYSKAGFPTKLGEYLSTGKPVVTTATGDIPLYLKDQSSAYLVMDSTVLSFAEKTIQAMTDSSASEIGLMGAKVAQEHFSIEASAKRIASFFGEIYGK